ncbi:MAG: chorismate-binding protein [Muribaculaceae bacterium]|nr:chorismate-binding protein [Muribaculaceae bacterium]
MLPQSLEYEIVSVVPWYDCSFRNDSVMDVATVSTPQDVYLDNVGRLVKKLRMRGGKSVLCRQICGTFKDFNLESIIRDYFSLFPDMFCFCFYHPSSGYWMGATPELLLESISGNVAITRALAGTKKHGVGEWSSKNTEEHQIVIDDMVKRISEVNGDIEIKTMPTYDFHYQNIDHLCTPIHLKTLDCKFEISKIINAIHPTAAVGGFPQAEALRDIKLYEDVRRHCYGGLIDIKRDDSRVVYVMLRCVHFDNEKWAIYTGSGITAGSSPEDEWIETADKATPLLKILEKYS